MRTRLSVTLEKARLARQYESDTKPKESIKKWREIFGDDFPEYTGT